MVKCSTSGCPAPRFMRKAYCLKCIKEYAEKTRKARLDAFIGEGGEISKLKPGPKPLKVMKVSGGGSNSKNYRRRGIMK